MFNVQKALIIVQKSSWEDSTVQEKEPFLELSNSNLRSAKRYGFSILVKYCFLIFLHALNFSCQFITMLWMSVRVRIQVKDCSWKWSFFHSRKLFFHKNLRLVVRDTLGTATWAIMLIQNIFHRCHRCSSWICILSVVNCLTILRAADQHLIWNVRYFLKRKYFFWKSLLEKEVGYFEIVFLKWFASANCTKFSRSSAAICTDLKELAVFTNTQ